MDLIITGTTRDYEQITQLYLGDGTGSFELKNDTLPKMTSGDVAFADLDLDGDLDLVTAGAGYNGFMTSSTRVYLNDGDANFSYLTDLTATWDGDIALADFDGDNLTDILISGNHRVQNPTYRSSRLYINLLDAPTKTSELTSAQQLEIYPNPNNGVFNVISNAKSFSRIKIIDNIGRVVFNEMLGHQEQLQISLNQQAGIYLVQLYNLDGEMIQTQKIIIK